MTYLDSVRYSQHIDFVTKFFRTKNIGRIFSLQSRCINCIWCYNCQSKLIFKEVISRTASCNANMTVALRFLFKFISSRHQSHLNWVENGARCMSLDVELVCGLLLICKISFFIDLPCSLWSYASQIFFQFEKNNQDLIYIFK